MRRRFIELFALVFCAFIAGARSLHATVPVPYALSAELAPDGHRAVLTLKIEARQAIGPATLALRNSDNLFLGSDQLPVSLTAGDLVRLPITVEWIGGTEPVGYVVARVLSGTTQVGYSVNVFYLSLVKGHLALLDETQLVAVLGERNQKEAAADADQRAEALARQLRARGRRLVPHPR